MLTGEERRLDKGEGCRGGMRRRESLHRVKNYAKVIAMVVYGLCADYKTLGKI